MMHPTRLLLLYIGYPPHEVVLRSCGTLREWGLAEENVTERVGHEVYSLSLNLTLFLLPILQVNE